MFTKQDAIAGGWTKMLSYRLGYGDGFNLWRARTPENQLEAQAYDRGYQVGLQARSEHSIVRLSSRK